MSQSVGNGAPGCTVAIYPLAQGGVATTVEANNQNSGLLNVTVTNTVRGMGGGFVLDFAPGGPNGPNADPSWANVIQPMSPVIIGMRRGGVAEIVMVGIVTEITMAEQRSNEAVQRGIQVKGQDFSYFFQTFTFYNLYALAGLGPAAVLGSAQGAATLSAALTQGTPATVASNWYQIVMLGLLAYKTFDIGKLTGASFAGVMNTTFQEYDYPGVQVPTGATYVSEGTSWQEGFNGYFPFPLYESYVVTAPVGAYGGTYKYPMTGKTYSIPGNKAAVSPIKLTGYPDASPHFINRVNPVPTLENIGSLTEPQLESSLNSWYGLPVFEPDNYGPFSIQLGYSLAEAANLYVINTTTVLTSIGISNQQVNPFNLTFNAWIDIRSVGTYGYRPRVTELQWWCDQTGAQAQQNVAAGISPVSFAGLIDAVNLRVAAYFEPTPQMAHGYATILLRPDILPGCVLRCAPYKDQVPWNFYIESVTHSFSFGRSAITTLMLSRGLPESVYNDQAMMNQVLTGNAHFLDGQIKTLSPNNDQPPLGVLNLQNAAQKLAIVTPFYTQPQAGTP